MENKELDLVVKKVDEDKAKEAQALKRNLVQELSVYKKNLPEELLTLDFQEEIDREVQLQVAEFQKNIDIKPKALYHALKVETELNPDLTEKDLKKSAYDFLEKTTQNNFLKKIIRELKKEI